MKSGELFIISAPSGTGKTTIIKKVVTRLAGLAFSVSHTTRKPRSSEQEGMDYYFVDRSVFVKMCDNHAFLEWAEVHGNLYGTSRKAVEEQLDRGVDVILDIDVQGARQVREASGLMGVSIFIVPPSWKELQRRLASRGTDSEESIRLRCGNARLEIADHDHYDFLIVNDEIENAVEMLCAVIIAERSRNRRLVSGRPVNFSELTGYEKE